MTCWTNNVSKSQDEESTVVNLNWKKCECYRDQVNYAGNEDDSVFLMLFTYFEIDLKYNSQLFSLAGLTSEMPR